MRLLQRLALWHHTAWGLLTFAVLELVVAYVFASLAINSGSLLHYGTALVALIGGVQNFIKLVRNLIHGNKAAKA